uniref:Uncharacterized protein n=1 Tax=Anguilla anguilla TaxID=7936 RepID=A0A0E9VX14_ANGAN
MTPMNRAPTLIKPAFNFLNQGTPILCSRHRVDGPPLLASAGITHLAHTPERTKLPIFIHLYSWIFAEAIQHRQCPHLVLKL